MKPFVIDINCDVGEGVGNEPDLFPYISSCNIACGGHAGDEATMRSIAALAQPHQVKIGAHPSYPDKPNFGREVMDISNEALSASIKNQLATFDGILEEINGKLHHIKAHGALYNETAKNEELAQNYLNAISEYRTRAIVYVPYGSVIASLAKAQGFELWFEGFADRNYNPDLSLVSRKSDKALIHRPEEVLNHVLPMICENRVLTISDQLVPIEVQTLCVHGDTSSALEILMYLSTELPNHQVKIHQ